jgi:hypothetical protein
VPEQSTVNATYCIAIGTAIRFTIGVAFWTANRFSDKST